MSRVKISTTKSKISDLKYRMRKHFEMGDLEHHHSYEEILRKLLYIEQWFGIYTSRRK